MKRRKGIGNIIKSAGILLLGALFAIQSATPVAATNLLDLINRGVNYYIPGDVCTSGTAPDTGGKIEPSGAQQNNMKTVIGVAKTMGITQKGALIAFMTVMQESGFNNWANDGHQQGGENMKNLSTSNPNSAGLPSTGGDHDSVGIFQQRATGWSTFGSDITKDTVWQIMGSTKSTTAVAYSAQAFFGTPSGAKLPSGLAKPGALKQGLLNKVPNYNDASVKPGVAAQTVQVSAFPDAYNKHEGRAKQLVDQLWNSSPPVPLVISLTGGAAPTGSGSSTTGCGTGENTPGNGSLQAVMDKIKEYAWPDYCKANHSPCPGYASATTKKPAYAAAVKRSKYKGDSCYGSGVDCGAFVTIVMRESGADPDYNKGNGPTGTQLAYLRANSGPGKKYIKVPSNKLQGGDIAIRDGHTFFYIGKVEGMNGDTASASQCQRAPMAGPMYDRDGFEWYRLVAPAGGAANPAGGTQQ
ncbi:MAG TPA: hypothetical protein VLA88_05860 [Candidatus Saccharimonadales bacterium]|nr:hypothetical protein [Candidatus Saccharimonadales bacterium]